MQCNYFFKNKKIKIFPFDILVKNEEEECSICLEHLKSKNIIYLSGCKHKFHISCIKEWFKNFDAPECPLCRSQQNKLNKRLNNI